MHLTYQKLSQMHGLVFYEELVGMVKFCLV